jgi:hypothetical protein
MSFVLAFVMLLTVTAIGVWTAQISSVATASEPLDMQAVLQEGDPFAFMKNEYGLGDSLQDEWVQTPQSVAVPVQRYIVKYKEGEEAQAREMVAPLVSSSQTVQEKVDRFKETASTSLTFVNPEMGGTPSRTDLATVDMERLEVLTLQEPLLPSELSQQLEDMGVGSHIRYIQPDFCLSLKDLSLELETTSDSGTTLTEETEVVFGGGTTSFESIEQTEGSEQAAPVLVAMIDTGVDTAHEDLADFLVEGYNATDGTNLIYGVDLPAAYTHGVHVAGLIPIRRERRMRM